MTRRHEIQRRWVLLAIIAAGVALMSAPASTDADEMAKDQPPPKRVFYEAAYVRETTDRPWTLQFGSGVMSRPGCYVIIHDTAGRLFIKHHLPYTGQAAGQPQTIHIPADGITGDYRILFVGFQNDSYNLDLPLTDLPFEVYGRTHFAARRVAPLLLRPTPGATKLTFSSYSGGLRVILNGESVADTTNDDPKGPRFRPVTITPKPGAVYQVDPYGCFYFSSTTPVFLTFDAARWFYPDTALEDVKWWQLTAPPNHGG